MWWCVPELTFLIVKNFEIFFKVPPLKGTLLTSTLTLCISFDEKFILFSKNMFVNLGFELLVIFISGELFDLYLSFDTFNELELKIFIAGEFVPFVKIVLLLMFMP